MRKKIYKVGLYALLLIAFLATVIIVPDFEMYKEKYKLRSQKLPNVYKTYPELSNLTDNDYEIIEIEYSVESIIQANDSTIVIVAGNSEELETGGWDTTDIWYKVNRKGQITDSLKYQYHNPKDPHSYRTYNDFIVDSEQNTYNNWIENNDTISYPFKNIDENKIFSNEEAKQIVADEKNIMYSDYIYLGDNGTDSKNKVTIFKDNTWNYFYAEKSWHESSGYIANEKEIGTSYLLDKETPAVAPLSGNEEKNKQIFVNINNPKSIIYREYLQKEEWARSSFWDIDLRWGGGSGGGSGVGWIGSSYFAIKMPKKTLHFKQRVTFDYPDGFIRNDFDYSFYKPENGEYLLLINYQQRSCFLIRPKQK